MRADLLASPRHPGPARLRGLCACGRPGRLRGAGNGRAPLTFRCLRLPTECRCRLGQAVSHPHRSVSSTVRGRAPGTTPDRPTTCAGTQPWAGGRTPSMTWNSSHTPRPVHADRHRQPAPSTLRNHRREAKTPSHRTAGTHGRSGGSRRGHRTGRTRTRARQHEPGATYEHGPASQGQHTPGPVHAAAGTGSPPLRPCATTGTAPRRSHTAPPARTAARAAAAGDTGPAGRVHATPP
jgi:hypothetical protein